MSNRLRAREGTDWNEESKEKARAILSDKCLPQFWALWVWWSRSGRWRCWQQWTISKKRKIVVQVLPWQRSRLKLMKKQLDEQHIKGLSSRAKGMRSERDRSGQSTREPPLTASKYDWAVRLGSNTSLLDPSIWLQKETTCYHNNIISCTYILYI